MTAWSQETVTLLAHTVHYALVVGGLLGLGALLAPRLVSSHAPWSSRPAAGDEHQRRVAALRTAAAAGRLAELGTPTPGPTPGPMPTSTPTSRAASPEASLLLPLAIIASTAAAGVHAAMGPLHFREATVFGLFFALAAVAQLGWTALALRSVTPALLRAGVALNLGCVVLWATTRAWGLPLGLMPTPEPVGPWDLAAVVWELGVVAACVALLRASPPASYAGLRLPAWVDWHRGARTVAVASVLVLGVLSLSGAGG